MANLTLRSVKGSPLTNAEMDGNFEYFTGSYALTGSLTTTEGIITSGSILISGSIIPNVPSGSVTSSFSLGSETAAWKDIYVSEGTIRFISSGSQTTISATPSGISVNGGPTLTGGGFSGSVTNTGSVSNSGSVNTVGSSNVTGSSNTSGSVTVIGTTTTTGSVTTSGSVNTTGSVNTSGSVNTTGSLSTSGSVTVIGTTTTTGSVTTSGSVNTTGSVNTSGSVTTVGNTTTTGSFTVTGSSTTTGSFTVTGSSILTGNLTLTGSILISGSIIPNVASGSATSSFSLGSPTNAWKDIYVSNGTINFLDGAGNTQGTLSSTANGIATSGDAYFNTVRVGQGPTTGSDNVVVGKTSFSATSSLTRIGNTAIGSNTLNVYIGGASGTNNYNTALGAYSLENLVSGGLNTALGMSALRAATTGTGNTSVGYSSLVALTTGTNNVGVGNNSMYQNTSGYQNTSIGDSSLNSLTLGNNNTALGWFAGRYAASTSEGNVYLGPKTGPTSSLTENNKLYINNDAGTPLIGGDFSTGVATINSILQLQRRTTNPGSPIEGMIMASGSAGSSKLYYYNGTAWIDLTA